METSIDVKQINELIDSWQFEVRVEDKSKTTHKVKVDKEYFDQFSSKFTSAQALVKESFKFLLKREPQETILKEFNLSVIEQYFPQYKELKS